MNGIYHVEFGSQIGNGTGTAYLDNGVVRGGDATVAYFGRYTIDNGVFSANIEVLKHGAGFSILGDANTLNFQGKIAQNSIIGMGTVPGTPVQAQIQMRKVASL